MGLVEYDPREEQLDELIAEFFPVFPMIDLIRSQSERAWFEIACEVFGVQAVATFMAWEVREAKDNG